MRLHEYRVLSWALWHMYEHCRVMHHDDRSESQSHQNIDPKDLRLEQFKLANGKTRQVLEISVHSHRTLPMDF